MVGPDRRAHVAALALLGVAACADDPGVLRAPPPLSARAFVFSVTEGDTSRVTAGPIAELDLRTAPLTDAAGPRTFALRYYDAELAALGLVAGALTAAPAGQPSRPLPTPDVFYVARRDDDRAHGWVAGPLTADPAATFRITCTDAEHDGGGGTCAPLGACVAGWYLALDGTCHATCAVDDTPSRTCEPYALRFTSDPLGRDVRPRLGDLDGDGQPELVVTAYNQVYVYRLDGLALLLESSLSLGATVQAAWGIGIGDTDGDGAPQLLIGTWRDDLFDLDYTTGVLTLKRRIPRQGYGNWTLEVRDLHPSPGNEVLVSDRYGYFRALRWDGAAYTYYYTSPRIGEATDQTGKTAMVGVGDTDGDGHLEVVTYSTLGLLDVWEVEGDGFTALHHVTFPTPDVDGADHFRATIGDVDGDGRDELFYADATGALVGLTWDGTTYVERWRFALGFTITTMALGDTDADPAKELVLGTSVGRTVVLDLDTGTTTELDKFASQSHWVVTADLDGDAKDEILVGYDDGFLRLYQHR